MNRFADSLVRLNKNQVLGHSHRPNMHRCAPDPSAASIALAVPGFNPRRVRTAGHGSFSQAAGPVHVSHRTGWGYGTAGGSMTAHSRAPIDPFGATSTITGRIASGVPIGGYFTHLVVPTCGSTSLEGTTTRLLNTGNADQRRVALPLSDSASPDSLTDRACIRHPPPSDLWSWACGRLCQVSRGARKARPVGVIVDMAGDGR
jgi:hypothetical protein